VYVITCCAKVGFFYLWKIVTTRASPLGIPRDIYRGRTQIRDKLSITRCCSPSCRCSGVIAELDFLPVVLEASGGCC
jgi:hypothetical protein